MLWLAATAPHAAWNRAGPILSTCATTNLWCGFELANSTKSYHFAMAWLVGVACHLYLQQPIKNSVTETAHWELLLNKGVKYHACVLNCICILLMFCFLSVHIKQGRFLKASGEDNRWKTGWIKIHQPWYQKKKTKVERLWTKAQKCWPLHSLVTSSVSCLEGWLFVNRLVGWLICG